MKLQVIGLWILGPARRLQKINLKASYVFSPTLLQIYLRPLLSGVGRLVSTPRRRQVAAAICKIIVPAIWYSALRASIGSGYSLCSSDRTNDS